MAKNQPTNASTQLGVCNGNTEGYSTAQDVATILAPFLSGGSTTAAATAAQIGQADAMGNTVAAGDVVITTSDGGFISVTQLVAGGGADTFSTHAVATAAQVGQTDILGNTVATGDEVHVYADGTILSLTQLLGASTPNPSVIHTDGSLYLPLGGKACLAMGILTSNQMQFEPVNGIGGTVIPWVFGATPGTMTQTPVNGSTDGKFEFYTSTNLGTGGGAAGPQGSPVFVAHHNGSHFPTGREEYSETIMYQIPSGATHIKIYPQGVAGGWNNYPGVVALAP